MTLWQVRVIGEIIFKNAYDWLTTTSTSSLNSSFDFCWCRESDSVPERRGWSCCQQSLLRTLRDFPSLPGQTGTGSWRAPPLPGQYSRGQTVEDLPHRPRVLQPDGGGGQVPGPGSRPQVLPEWEAAGARPPTWLCSRLSGGELLSAGELCQTLSTVCTDQHQPGLSAVIKWNKLNVNPVDIRFLHEKCDGNNTQYSNQDLHIEHWMQFFSPGNPWTFQYLVLFMRWPKSSNSWLSVYFRLSTAHHTSPWVNIKSLAGQHDVSCVLQLKDHVDTY